MPSVPPFRQRFPAQKPPVRFRRPIVILAGGADGEGSASNAAARRLFVAAFSGFAGTVVSGGTTAGIAGIAGEVAAAHPRLDVVGYLPRHLPPGAKRDLRYTRFRTTPAETFSAAECALYWLDLLIAGVDPTGVRLLGWGGGRIAAVEYRVALSFGARVGLIDGTGRAADEMKADAAWNRAPILRFLPADPRTVRAFLGPRPKASRPAGNSL